MKIWRYRSATIDGHSYAYIKANFFERIYLRGRMSHHGSGIYEVENWMFGPKNHGAQFIMRPKSFKPKYKFEIKERLKKQKAREPKKFNFSFLFIKFEVSY